MSKYLSLLIVSGIMPLALSFWPPLKFWKNFKALMVSIALIVLIFGGWDIFAVFRGHWRFNPDYIYGINIINLPIEEIGFFIVIPFCCIFTWEAINYIRKRLR